MYLDLELRRQTLIEEPEPRPLGDGVNGVVHLPRSAATAVKADLPLTCGERIDLAAGALPDGRSVTFEVVVHAPRSDAAR